MQNDSVVGYYEAAIKIKTILVSVVTSLGAVILPRASYYIESKKENEFNSILQKAMNLVITIALPLTVYFLFHAEESIYFLSGEEYKMAIVPMRIIMPTLFLIGVSNIIGFQVFVPLGKEKLVLYSQLIGTISNVIINACLIPSMSAIGAAVGTLLAESAVFCYLNFQAKQLKIAKTYAAVRWGPIILAITTAQSVCLIFKIIKLSPFIGLISSFSTFGAVYFIVLYLFKVPIVIDTLRDVELIFHKLIYKLR